MDDLFKLLLPSLTQTLYMVSVSTIVSLMLGFPIGILLVITDKNGLWEKLMIVLFPLSRLIVGKSIGTTAPFVARVIESSLREVDSGVIEAVSAMGASNREIIFKVLIPEAMPSLVSPYGNIIAVRNGDDRPELETLLRVLQSDKIKIYIANEFEGAVIPGF